MRPVPCALSFVYHFISYNCSTFIYLRASPLAPAASLCQSFSDYITQLLMASQSSAALLPVSCHFQHFLDFFLSLCQFFSVTWRLCDMRRETNVEHVEVWQTKCESAHTHVCPVFGYCLPSLSLSLRFSLCTPLPPTLDVQVHLRHGQVEHCVLCAVFGDRVRPDSGNCHINCRLSCSLLAARLRQFVNEFFSTHTLPASQPVGAYE